MSYRTWDVETTTRTSFKRKANPFDDANFVVMSGHKYKDGRVIGEYFGRDKKPFDWFTKLLVNTKILVGQNIKFDLLYALREPQNLEAWMQWVADGGNVWDIQLAEYLLNGMSQEDHMLSMDLMAPRYGGNLKIDEVKMLWNAGVDTIDIDEDLLTRYLIGTKDDHGDIGNTELIFLAQLERSRQAKQTKSILLNMGSLLCTIEMERNGMMVDEVLAYQQAEELQKALAEIKSNLDTFLPKDLPFEFNWTNRYHLSPLIFGGKVKFEKRVHTKDEHGVLLYAQTKQEHYCLAGGGTISKEHFLATSLPPQLAYFKAGKNAGEAKTKQVSVNDLTKPKTRMEDFFYAFPRMTEPERAWKSSTEGLWSVASEVIEILAMRDIPFLKNLGKVQAMSKDLGTYYISEDGKGGKKGMLTMVQNGIIHHSINHTSTVTGRFSSSNPNLQNIPKEGKSVVKSIFISRFKDGVICQSDFTALEVYVQAILTKCKQLILDLQAGLDMHCVRVSQKEGITYEEALLRCKGDKSKGIAALPEWDKKRTGAKVFSFQRAYGAGAKKISDSTGIPLEDIEALIRAEQERYPEVDRYYIDLTKLIEANRYPTSRFCKHPANESITCQLGRSTMRTPDNKLYLYQESPTPDFVLKRTGKTVGFSPTEIKNYVVQGQGGEWAKAAMWLAVREFYRHKNFNQFALLVNQVHDALYGDFAKDVHFQAAVVLHACMEGASDFMEYYFGWEVPVPVPSVTECGPNMMTADEMQGEDWKKATREARLALRKRYMNDYVPSFERQ
jgi:DNA polymerase I-like protein with 3'-5' exonuclease and polymerase domains